MTINKSYRHVYKPMQAYVSVISWRYDDKFSKVQTFLMLYFLSTPNKRTVLSSYGHKKEGA
jgi:hypothetical protein